MPALQVAKWVTPWNMLMRITANIYQRLYRTEHFPCGILVLTITLWVSAVSILSLQVTKLSSERLSDLTKVTQPVNDRAWGTGAQI